MSDHKKLLDQPIEIKVKDTTYLYDYNEVELVQGSIAKQIGYWQYIQTQRDLPSKLDEILRSGSPTWKEHCVAYLLKEKKSDGSLVFNKNEVESKVFPAICSLPDSEESTLDSIVNDFFLKKKLKIITEEILFSNEKLMRMSKLIMQEKKLVTIANAMNSIMMQSQSATTKTEPTKSSTKVSKASGK